MIIRRRGRGRLAHRQLHRDELGASDDDVEDVAADGPARRRRSVAAIYDEAPGPADRGDALAASGGPRRPPPRSAR
jgi:hypothetical protein